MIAYGGDRRRPDLLPVPVSLTRSGYPRIIPSFHRQIIRRKDERADLVVKVYLSFFSLSKVICLAKKIDKSTFSSIIQPWDDPDRVLTQVGKVKEFLPTLLRRYLPWLPTITLQKGMTWEPTWKALPTHGITTRILESRVLKSKGAARNLRSVFTSLAYEISGFNFLVQYVYAQGEQWSQGCLWASRVRYALDKNNKLFTGTDLDFFESRLGPLFPTCDDLKCPPITGRLGMVVEGGGRRRSRKERGLSACSSSSACL